MAVEEKRKKDGARSKIAESEKLKPHKASITGIPTLGISEAEIQATAAIPQACDANHESVLKIAGEEAALAEEKDPISAQNLAN